MSKHLSLKLALVLAFGISSTGSKAAESLRDKRSLTSSSADPGNWQQFNPYKFRSPELLVPAASILSKRAALYMQGAPLFPHDPTRNNIIYGRGKEHLPTEIYAKAFDILKLSGKFFQAPAAGDSKGITVNGQTITLFGTTSYTPLPDSSFVANPVQIVPFDPSCVFYNEGEIWPAVIYAKPEQMITIANQPIKMPAAGQSRVVVFDKYGRLKDPESSPVSDTEEKRTDKSKDKSEKESEQKTNNSDRNVNKAEPESGKGEVDKAKTQTKNESEDLNAKASGDAISAKDSESLEKLAGTDARNKSENTGSTGTPENSSEKAVNSESGDELSNAVSAKTEPAESSAPVGVNSSVTGASQSLPESTPKATGSSEQTVMANPASSAGKEVLTGTNSENPTNLGVATSTGMNADTTGARPLDAIASTTTTTLAGTSTSNSVGTDPNTNTGQSVENVTTSGAATVTGAAVGAGQSGVESVNFEGPLKGGVAETESKQPTQEELRRDNIEETLAILNSQTGVDVYCDPQSFSGERCIWTQNTRQQLDWVKILLDVFNSFTLDPRIEVPCNNYSGDSLIGIRGRWQKGAPQPTGYKVGEIAQQLTYHVSYAQKTRNPLAGSHSWVYQIDENGVLYSTGEADVRMSTPLISIVSRSRQAPTSTGAVPATGKRASDGY